VPGTVDVDFPPFMPPQDATSTLVAPANNAIDIAFIIVCKLTAINPYKSPLVNTIAIFSLYRCLLTLLILKLSCLLQL
jgi:hypothetical protein